MSDDKIKKGRGMMPPVGFWSDKADAAEMSLGGESKVGAQEWSPYAKLKNPEPSYRTLAQELHARREKLTKEYEHHSFATTRIGKEIDDLDLAISALTPPLQHKGGETGAAIPEGFLRSYSGTCEAPSGTDVEYIYEDGVRGYGVAQNGWIGHPVRTKTLPADLPIIAYRIISSSEADSGPRSSLAQGDERIEPPISTLQASSGEGETDETELAAFLRLEGAVKHNGGPRPIPVGSHMEMLTRGCGVWPVRNIEEFSSHWHWDGEEEHSTNIIAYRPIEAPASSTLSTTEPAAYSPVNNADEPVTKPEADVFARGILGESQRQADEAAYRAALRKVDMATDAEIDESVRKLQAEAEAKKEAIRSKRILRQAQGSRRRGRVMGQPVDMRSYRSSEQKVIALEDAKAALKKHHDHMREHYAELQGHLAVVDEQLQMADTAMEAIDAQLLIHRGGC